MNPTQQIELDVSAIESYLGNEFGYASDGPGHLRQAVEENSRMIRETNAILRGTGDEIGLVGWASILRRSWITLVALIGTAFGYALNDVIDQIEHGNATASQNRPYDGSR